MNLKHKKRVDESDTGRRVVFQLGDGPKEGQRWTYESFQGVVPYVVFTTGIRDEIL